jgi:hypothetical protein
MAETGERYKMKPRIVVVASEVHYWTTLKDEVFESGSAFRTISNKEYGYVGFPTLDLSVNS